MSTHYHLLLETPRGNLTDAMKWFQGTFTQRYNARNKRWGHLFQKAAQAVLRKCLKHFGRQPEAWRKLPKSDPIKMLITGLLRYPYPVSVESVSEQLCMAHFTTVSRAMRFYDGTEGKWEREKYQILRFIG